MAPSCLAASRVRTPIATVGRSRNDCAHGQLKIERPALPECRENQLVELEELSGGDPRHICATVVRNM